MKVIVYTCITGNYDNLIELTKKEDNYEYICFTNNKDLKSKTWKIKLIDEVIDNWTLARKVKILSYKYLPKHDLSIWVDGAIKILKPISEFINKECELDNYDMVGFKHKFRDCIYDELSANVELRKETIDNCKKIEELLLKEKYPKHNGLIESTVLIRKNKDDVNKLMDSWFDMIERYSRRDQLSFNYCLWKNPIKIKYLDMWVFDCKYFKHIGHNKIKYLDYRIIFDDKNPFDYHDAIDNKVVIKDNKVVIQHKCIKDTNKIVLQMPNEIGNIISNLKINNKKNCYDYFNIRVLNDDIYFYDTPIILFNGDYKKGDNIVITFSIDDNSRSVLVEEIYKENLKYNNASKDINDLNNRINEYKKNIKEEQNKYNILEKSYNDIINSKAWKLADRLRKIKHKIIRK